MKYYLVLLGLLLLGGTISLIFRLPGRLNRQISELCWNNLWIGAVLFFFRYQHIPILGMDLWRLLQEIAIVVWFSIIILRFRQSYPKERLADKVLEYRTRYLPKSKTK